MSSSASGCVSAAISTTPRRARPSTIRNRRRSSSRRSRTCSERLTDPLQRSQVEHGLRPRQRRGSCPRWRRPPARCRTPGRLAPWAVSTCTASSTATSRALQPGPVLAGIERLEERLHAGVGPARAASATTLANVTDGVELRRPRRPPAASTSRAEHGSSSHRTLNASCTDMPANSAALASVARAAFDRVALRRGRARRCDRGRQRRRAAPARAANRINPRAAAGDSPTTSEVSSGSISSSRRGASATSHRSASTYG